MKNIIALGLGILISVSSISAQVYGEQPTYPGRENYGALRFSQSSAWFSYVMLPLHQRDVQRSEELSVAFRSKKDMLQYQKTVRERMCSVVGELPQRGDLQAKVVGIVKGDGFKVEKIVFQSIPGRYVTAHLYLPEQVEGRIPACVELCGHALRGKGDNSIIAERMAVNGIAVMVVDPLGQGERLQLIDEKGTPLTRGVTTEHTLINPAFNLLGSSLEAQIYFDNSRAIDYLQSRQDIDPESIGAYGFSGGGTETSYIFALDERVKAACVGLFFSSRLRTLEIQGPSDGCQQIPGEGREGIEIADMAIMAAPKPFIILDGKYDFVDHFGALQGYEELRKCYSLLGAPEKVAQYYAEDGHATPIDVQTKMVSWFKRWLAGDEGPLKEVPNENWKGSGMLCTTVGQVNLGFSDAKSTMDETLETYKSLEGARKQFCSSDIESIRSKMLSLLGLPEKFNDEVEFVPTGRSHQREYEEYRFQINCTGQFPIPCVVWVPSNVREDSPVEIHLHEQGKAWYLQDYLKRDAIFNGNIIVAADFRGLGETEDPYIYNFSKYWNKDYRTSATALHAGHPLLGQRVADMRTLLNFCSSSELLEGRSVMVVADGVYGPVVMHSAVLDPRIVEARLTRCLKTWRDYLENPLQRDMLANVVEGVLKYYDLPDLISLSEGRVKVVD